jgi:ABC-2 type transport system ATP-binding protein
MGVSIINIIELKAVSKKYGNVQAAKDITFEVQQNEIFALVGPNGAGKTTIIEIIEGLRKPDSGTVAVNGKKPGDKEVREMIGVQLQNSAFYDKIKVKECIDMFRGFYKNPLPTAEVLEKLGLEKNSDRRYGKLSGGMKQRTAIGVALAGNSEILFLDEITTGLDPQARRALWDLIRELRKDGKTIFMTTHYMEEAEKLADLVGIMDHGEIIVLDNPKNLIRRFGESRVIYEGPVLDIGEKADSENGKVIFRTNDPQKVASSLLREASKQKTEIRNLTIEEGHLEDVFIALTGKEMRE